MGEILMGNWSDSLMGLGIFLVLLTLGGIYAVIQSKRGKTSDAAPGDSHRSMDPSTQTMQDLRGDRDESVDHHLH